jgi:RNA 2',3'-cyclic 3'-phosphodiesterase
MGKTRTFIGVDVGADVRDSAAALQQELARACDGVNWVTTDNYHVTLLFIGDVDDTDLHAICRAVKTVSATEPAFDLAVSGVGAFPNARRPKVLWGAVSAGAENLQRLYAGIEEHLLNLRCYRAEERGYTPHLTLGRATTPEAGFAAAAELPKYAKWTAGRVRVTEVLVYSSEMERDGPVYRVIGRAPLTGKPPKPVRLA